MKQYILFITLILFGYTSLFGQSYEVKSNVIYSSNPIPNITIENTKNLIRNDSIRISFDFGVYGKIISSKDALYVVPVYKTSTNEYRFSPILINGKTRDKYYRREQLLSSHEEYWKNKPYSVLVQSKVLQKLNYHSENSFPENVEINGKLYLEYILHDCCDKCILGIYDMDFESEHVSPEISKPIYEGLVTFIRPKVEKVKIRNEYITVRIKYPVDKYRVLPNFDNNNYELNKVDNILRPLSTRDKDYQLIEASIKGYASPEATYDYNLRLSERRAYYFKDYIMNRYKLNGLNKFWTKGMGEDWIGLREAVEKSNMNYKKDITNIIDNIDIFSGREKQLMDLYGGQPYKYMLKHLFPPLRRMEMVINYKVRSFEIEEAETLIKERPQDLSQQEIYDLALERKDKEKLKVAAKYFPDDDIANINASSAALVKGDIELAIIYLKKVWNNPKAYNNIGVYYLIKGNRKEAEKYFLKALSEGGDVEKAGYNLKKLHIKY